MCRFKGDGSTTQIPTLLKGSICRFNLFFGCRAMDTPRQSPSSPNRGRRRHFLVWRRLCRSIGWADRGGVSRDVSASADAGQRLRASGRRATALWEDRLQWVRTQRSVRSGPRGRDRGSSLPVRPVCVKGIGGDRWGRVLWRLGAVIGGIITWRSAGPGGWRNKS